MSLRLPGERHFRALWVTLLLSPALLLSGANGLFGCYWEQELHGPCLSLEADNFRCAVQNFLPELCSSPQASGAGRLAQPSAACVSPCGSGVQGDSSRLYV